MIPPKQVQEILDALRIEEVVGEFVTLRKRGVNLLGLCPFHNEKTPSFNVNPTRNIFKCFGCGKGGDAITFLIEHEKFTYPDALRWLAKKYNIELQEVERSPEQMLQMQMSDSLYIVNDFGLQHFQQQLFETDEGKSVALAYFRQRGLREETIRTFGLGYAPNQRDLLVQRAKAAGHSLELLKKTGLCSADGTRDFFRGRVMFAIHNLSGKVAAFAGRTMSSDKATPKYVNSPETEIYVKNRTLYGAFQAKKAIRQADECILVEGYMDVISLYQAGIENVVASSGTSLTEGQISLIRRDTLNLMVLYDGDSAGSKAAERGYELSLEQGMNVRIALLPAGEDPDTFVQKVGAESVREFIKNEAESIVVFKAKQLLEEASNDPLKKSRVIKEIARIISLIPHSFDRAVFEREIINRFKVFSGDKPEELFHQEVEKNIHSRIQKWEDKREKAPESVSDSPDNSPNPEQPVPDPTFPRMQEKSLLRGDEFQERDIVRLLMQFGSHLMPKENITVGEYLLTDIEELLGNFDNPLYGKIATECHGLLVEGRSFDQHYFIQHSSPEVCELAITLLTSPYDFSPNWEDKWNYPLQNQPMPELNFSLDVRQALDRFKLRKVLKMCEVNLGRVRSTSESGDTEGMLRYMKIQQKLYEKRDELAKRLGTVVLPR